MTSPSTLTRSAEQLSTAVRWTRAQWLLLMVVCTVLALDGLTPGNVRFSAADVVITTGSQQMLYLLGELLLDPEVHGGAG